MKRLLRNVICLALMLVCVLALPTDTAASDSERWGELEGGFRWKLVDGILTVAGTGDMPDIVYPWQIAQEG